MSCYMNQARDYLKEIHVYCHKGHELLGLTKSGLLFETEVPQYKEFLELLYPPNQRPTPAAQEMFLWPELAGTHKQNLKLVSAT